MDQIEGNTLPAAIGSADKDRRVRLDRLDIRILAALQSDGRMSNLKLSEMIGLSPTPCLQRVRRLENAGFITAYRAILDLRRFASHVTVHTDLTLRRRTLDQTQSFERYVRSQPNIVECYLVSGGFDYILKIIARDVEHYREIMEDMLTAEVGVERFSSFIAMAQIKEDSIFPLTTLQPNLAPAHSSGRQIRRG